MRLPITSKPCEACFRMFRGTGDMVYQRAKRGGLTRVRACPDCARTALVIIGTKLDVLASKIKEDTLLPIFSRGELGGDDEADEAETPQQPPTIAGDWLPQMAGAPVATPQPAPTSFTMPPWVHDTCARMRSRGNDLACRESEYDQGVGEGMRLAADLLDQAFKFSDDEEEP